MGFFDLFKKKPIKVSEERLDRLTSDGSLPFGWYSATKEFRERVENEHHYFVENWIESKKGSPKEQYVALKSLVVHMADVRRICREKDECFVYWSTALFSDKDYQDLQDELEDLKKNLNDLQDNYQRDLYIKECILPQLPSIIKEKPGILQTDIYKMFPVDCKGLISSELYNLSGSGKIIREKSGRTYSLRIK